MRVVISVINLVLSVIIFYLLAVLFGAPVFSLQKETLIFAITLTVCASVPSIITISTWSDFFRIHFDSNYLKNKERTAAILAKSSIFGAWIGAFPIPLDWDRWWQAWPITCVVGCVAGFIFGLLYTRLFKIQRQSSAPSEFKPKSV